MVVLVIRTFDVGLIGEAHIGNSIHYCFVYRCHVFVVLILVFINCICFIRAIL